MTKEWPNQRPEEERLLTRSERCRASEAREAVVPEVKW